MVRRSLVLKIFLYGLAVLAVSLPMSFMIGQSFRDMGRREGIRHFMQPQLTYLEREVERSLTSDRPDPARLAELGRALRQDIRFVPWREAGGYPSELVDEPVLVDERPPDQAPQHWVRIDRAGKPVGALALSPNFGRGPRPGPPIPHLAWIWVLILVLLIVPPIWFWVLRPLKHMAGVARRLGSGDLETPVAVRHHDEFGELERAFEGMRIELRRVLQQKERLLTDVSHEVRGPLARMTLALPLLRQDGASGPIMDTFARELKSADTMLADVLALSRGRSTVPVMAPVDVAAVAHALLSERFLVLDQQGQRLEARLQPAAIVGDERLVARAMGNLLDNAIKYTPASGHIRVITETVGDMAIFRVEDDGPGIAGAHMPLLFEPFYRPDDSRSRETGGTGLGLAIVRSIMDGHGGTVELQSVEGQGTRAELRWPARAVAVER
ncbi:MAG: sensor histidine kinase [Candidatus Sericytochromatia bacterium]